MRHKRISITDKSVNLLSYDMFRDGETNRDKIKEMKSLLYEAIDSGLTEKQKYCMVEYFLKNRTMENIAEELNCNKSTVWKHITRAKKRLQGITRYYH